MCMAEFFTAQTPSIALLLWVCSAPSQVDEFALSVPAGTTVSKALVIAEAQGVVIETTKNTGVSDGCTDDHQDRRYGIWGRIVTKETILLDQDRLEVYRPLVVDPKHARRERFSRQGARGAGLFEKRRVGAKAGY
jgi:putative ubiquitin-RnfH superfamily antitoxin RatB of RatAB toxin-antitoxin module